MIAIFNGGEVRVMGTRSGFFFASVLAFAFPIERFEVNTLESVFAFALRSSLTFPEMNTWMLDDESFRNSVKISLVTD